MKLSNNEPHWCRLQLLLLCLAIGSFQTGCAPSTPDHSVAASGNANSNAPAANSDFVQQSPELGSEQKILFLGNSHTGNHNVPEIVKRLFNADQDVQVAVESIRGPFLDTIGSRADVRKKIRNGKWDFIVLQGQKISMSGQFSYSTETAEELSALGKDAGAQVIWFSEWARKGVPGETERIQTIYETIAAKNKDIIAPTGLVWQAVLNESPDLDLHAADGNHSNQLGATLAAMTLYVAITGIDSNRLPAQPLDGLSEPEWSLFKATVSQQTSDLVSDDERAEQWADAIANVLEMDNRLGTVRNDACKSESLEKAVKDYVDAMNQIDFDSSPPRFEDAFRAHIQAWNDSKPFFKKHAHLRGEMHDLFEEIRNHDEQAKNDLEKIEKQIWGTWDLVEKAAQEYRTEIQEQQ